jgi:hypothetical protein
LIVDAMPLITADGKPPPAGTPTGRWDKLLPVEEDDPVFRIMRAIQQRCVNVFGPRTSASTMAGNAKAIIYPKPTPDKIKMLFRGYRYVPPGGSQ